MPVAAVSRATRLGRVGRLPLDPVVGAGVPTWPLSVTVICCNFCALSALSPQDPSHSAGGSRLSGQMLNATRDAASLCEARRRRRPEMPVGNGKAGDCRSGYCHGPPCVGRVSLANEYPYRGEYDGEYEKSVESHWYLSP